MRCDATLVYCGHVWARGFSYRIRCYCPLNTLNCDMGLRGVRLSWYPDMLLVKVVDLLSGRSIGLNVRVAAMDSSVLFVWQ